MSLSSRVLLLAILLLLPVPSTSLTPNARDRLTQAYAFIAYPRVFDGLIATRLETPVQFRALLYLNLATFNAWANFHPTSADFFGRTRFKLPPSMHTSPNKNTAILYALLRLYEASPASFGGPSGIPGMRHILTEMGLDPDDRSTDTTTVIGVGNRAGIDTARLMAVDNWNADGSASVSQPLYALPFQDYTGYTPVNSPWEITSPFRWQPLLETNDLGFFFRQEHVVPFAGQSIAFSMTPAELAKRRVTSPYKNRHAKDGKDVLGGDIATLRKLARGVFKTSREIGEKERILAELFDNKVNAFRTEDRPFGAASIGVALRFDILGPQLDYDLDADVIYGMAANIATYDAIVTVWKEKRRHDAIRPTGQTMEYLFGNRKVKVGGAPYGPNVEIEAKDWQPYIRTMPHSEFPSASACACSALVEHGLVASEGRDLFPYNVTVTKGSSVFGGPGFPREDVVIAIDKLSDWGKLCGESRLWAGVHFEPSVKAGAKLCQGIGKEAQKVVDAFVEGGTDARWMSWLADGVDKFWEEP